MLIYGGNSTWWKSTRVIFRPFSAFLAFWVYWVNPPPLTQYGSSPKNFFSQNGLKWFWHSSTANVSMDHTLFRRYLLVQWQNCSEGLCSCMTVEMLPIRTLKADMPAVRLHLKRISGSAIDSQCPALKLFTRCTIATRSNFACALLNWSWTECPDVQLRDRFWVKANDCGMCGSHKQWSSVVSAAVHSHSSDRKYDAVNYTNNSTGMQ